MEPAVEAGGTAETKAGSKDRQIVHGEDTESLIGKDEEPGAEAARLTVLVEAALSVGRTGGETEAAAVDKRVGDELAGEHRLTRRLADGRAGARVQKRVEESGHVRGGRAQTRSGRRQNVVDRHDRTITAGVAVRDGVITQQFLGKIDLAKARSNHPERKEHVLIHVRFEGQAARTLDEVAREGGSVVVVRDHESRRQTPRRQTLRQILGKRQEVVWITNVLSQQPLIESGGVGEQVVCRDGAERRWQLHVLEVPIDVCLEIERATLDLLQHGQRRQGLGDRTDAEHRSIRIDWHLPFAVGKTIPGEMHGAISADDDHRHAGNAALETLGLDELLDEPGDIGGLERRRDGWRLPLECRETEGEDEVDQRGHRPLLGTACASGSWTSRYRRNMWTSSRWIDFSSARPQAAGPSGNSVSSRTAVRRKSSTR